MTDLNLDAIEARAEAATEGPWQAVSTGRSPVENYVCRPDGLGVAMHWAFVWQSDDAQFIAHARADVPALLAAVRTLTAENERLRAAVKFQREGAGESPPVP